MDWQTFIQWFFIVSSSASIFGAFLAWASRKNGKETRKFLDELITKMNEMAEQRHKQVAELLKTEFEMAEQRHKQVAELLMTGFEMAEQRHKEVVELLKTGFGEVLGKM